MGKRKAYTPFSTSSEAGVTAAPVEGYILVDQEVRPTIDTGFVDSKGQWIGHQTSDTAFDIYQKDEAIANTGTILTPSPNADGTWPLNMTGYCDVILAIKPTNGGNCSLTAIMASGGLSFANLKPVDAAVTLRGVRGYGNDVDPLFNDSAESMTADVWNIFVIQNVLRNQKLLQFQIQNNSGGISTIETAFMRMI